MKKLVFCFGIVCATCQLIQAQSVRISEIMSDPQPSRGLPGAEYLEIFIIDSLIKTKNWTIEDASGRVGYLDHRTLRSGEWAVLCEAKDQGLFHNSIGVYPWPVLNNSTDRLILRDSSGRIVDSVTYFQKWHSERYRDGGTSLELLNPFYRCDPEGNWQSSRNEQGGTPGVINSSFKEFLPSEGPVLSHVYADSEIHIWINKAFDLKSVAAENIKVVPGIRIIDRRREGNHFVLVPERPLIPRVKYQVEWSDLYGCDGSLSEQLQSGFTVSEPPLPGDISVNEILFNPSAGNSDYLEVVNSSDKQLTLHGLIMERMTESGKEIRTVLDSLIAFYPEEILVITENRSSMLIRYPETPVENILEVPGLINFPDSEGLVKIKNQSGQLMEEIYYHQGFHHLSLTDLEDISLERVTLSKPALTSDNWLSASESSGFGTPGMKNSQRDAEGIMLVDLENSVISDDNVVIEYEGIPAGSTMNVKVFDLNGRETGNVVTGFLGGTSGKLHFLCSAVGIARRGAFLVWVEVLTGHGSSFRFVRRLFHFP